MKRNVRMFHEKQSRAKNHRNLLFVLDTHIHLMKLTNASGEIRLVDQGADTKKVNKLSNDQTVFFL